MTKRWLLIAKIKFDLASSPNPLFKLLNLDLNSAVEKRSVGES